MSSPTWALLAMDILEYIIYLVAYKSPIQRMAIKLVCKRFRTAVVNTPLMRPVQRPLPPEATQRRGGFYSGINEFAEREIALQERRQVIINDRKDFIDHCVKTSNLHLLRWAIEVVHFQLPANYDCRPAIHVGNIHMFEYLYSRGVPLGGSILKEASAFGHVHLINWAFERLEDTILSATQAEEERHVQSKRVLGAIAASIKDITGRTPEESKRKRDFEKANQEIMHLSPGDILKSLLVINPRADPPPHLKSMLDERKEWEQRLAASMAGREGLAAQILGKRGRTYDEREAKVRIPVYQGQYLKDIRVGSPGKYMTLRMRWDLNQSYLYDSPLTYSETFTTAGSDLFFLSPGVEPVRLKVVYSQEPSQTTDPLAPFFNGARQDTSGGVTYHGVLAMGDSSELWTTWTEYTLSKYTLTLGKDDDVDVLKRGPTIRSDGDQLFTSYIDGKSINTTMPLELSLRDEFTYLPQSVFPNVSKELENGSKIALLMEGTTDPSPTPRLILWLSTESNSIDTTLGGSEDALRLSEMEGKDSSRITVGRIQLLEDFVIHKDFVRQTTHVSRVFDTFPAATDGEFPQSALVIITLILFCLWNLVTTPGVYQWLAGGILPHHKGTIAHLKKIGKRASETAKKRDGKDALIGADSNGQRHTSQQERVSRRGPVDWTLIRSLLFLSRMLAFWTFFIAVWGYRSGRFSARLAAIAGSSHAMGTAIFWMVQSYSLMIPFVVNVFFIRRFTQAGITLISTALGAMLWINRLPATHTVSFVALARNLLIAFVVSLDVWSWPFWSIIRGPDAMISDRITDAKDFHPETSYVQDEALPLTRGPEPFIDIAHGPESSEKSPVRDRKRVYEAGEIILLFLWVVAIIPISVLWLTIVNLVPFLQSELPQGGVAILGAVTACLIVIYFSYVTPIRTCLQIYEAACLEYRDPVQEILTKMEKD